MHSVRVVYTGTTEYITVPVTSTVTLDTQAVHISFDRTTWYAATWVGEAGTTRSAVLLLIPANTPAKGSHPIFIRLTDNPESPIAYAGVLEVW